MPTLSSYAFILFPPKNSQKYQQKFIQRNHIRLNFRNVKACFVLRCRVYLIMSFTAKQESEKKIPSIATFQWRRRRRQISLHLSHHPSPQAHNPLYLLVKKKFIFLIKLNTRFFFFLFMLNSTSALIQIKYEKRFFYWIKKRKIPSELKLFIRFLLLLLLIFPLWSLCRWQSFDIWSVAPPAGETAAKFAKHWFRNRDILMCLL